MKINSAPEIMGDTKSSQTFKGVPKNPKYIPEFVGNLGKVAGDYIRTPEQKLFLAFFALVFHPIMDLIFAQEDKKEDAAIKSASKAMAGGITGVTIRALFQRIMEKYIGFDKHNKFNEFFLPSKAVSYSFDHPELAEFYLKEYKKTFGSIVAILVMILFTNSKLDVPLTNDLQDIITGVVKENKSWIKSIGDTGYKRCNKIKDWFNKKKEAIDNIRIKLKKIGEIIHSDNIDNDKESKQ